MMSEANIYLRPLTEADTDNIVRWRNLPSVKNNLYSNADITVETHLNYFRKIVRSGKCRQFIIVVQTGEEEIDIGTTFLKNIDEENQKAEYGIFIGEESARGKGFGTKAAQETLKIAFQQLGLNKIYLSVFSKNIPAIKSYLQAGFLVEGNSVQDFCRDGRFYDVTYMGITRDRWNNMANVDENTEEN